MLKPLLAALALTFTLFEADAARMPGPPATASSDSAPGLAWRPWSEQLFAQAKREKRFILLDLEAVWCHWCHVMEQTTYHDASVAAIIAAHYLPVKVDQDARPDLSRRYDEYGWPATVIFDPSGREIVKRRGYIPPERMVRLLQAVVADPSPIRYVDQASIDAYSTSDLLPEDLRTELTRRLIGAHDFARGGLTQEQKFLDRDTVEYAMLLSRKGDDQARRLARQDLDQAVRLIDPVWGGAYQYSTDGDWDHPHFEKLLQIQADELRVYALAHMVFGDTRYLKAAKDIHRYVVAFLTSPEGAFYVSQDADLIQGRHGGEYFSLDDAGRRQRGLPAVDRHLYAREQGWMIQALAQLYSATLDGQYLHQAVTAAEWALKHRRLPNGGFRHDEHDVAGPYLEDSIAMGQGLLALYAVTGERKWLAYAQEAGVFARKSFAAPRAGYATAADRGQVLKPKPQIDENVAAARFFDLLAHYTGNAEYQKDAQHAMRFLVTREVALLRMTNAGILLAAAELGADPVHLTVVGRKDDPKAQALFKAAVRYPAGYRRIEWWDRREGALPNPDVQYPELPEAAAFVCTNAACSLPQFQAEGLLALAARLESAVK